MKFLDKLVGAYKKLESKEPQWVKEYVAPVSTTTSITPTTTSPNLGQAISDTLNVEHDPELAKKKEELDTVYKQVADVLKKKAAEATNKLKQTSSSLNNTPSTTIPSTTIPTTPSV